MKKGLLTTCVAEDSGINIFNFRVTRPINMKTTIQLLSLVVGVFILARPAFAASAWFDLASGSCSAPIVTSQITAGETLLILSGDLTPGTPLDYKISPFGSTSRPGSWSINQTAYADANGLVCVEAFTTALDDYGSFIVTVHGLDSNQQQYNPPAKLITILPAPTPTPTASNTATSVPTNTPTPSLTPTITPIPSSTPTSTPTNTPTPSLTPTATPSETPSPSNTPLPTDIPTLAPTDPPPTNEPPTVAPTDTLTPPPSATLPPATKPPTATFVPPATATNTPFDDISISENAVANPTSSPTPSNTPAPVIPTLPPQSTLVNLTTPTSPPASPPDEPDGILEQLQRLVAAGSISTPAPDLASPFISPVLINTTGNPIIPLTGNSVSRRNSWSPFVMIFMGGMIWMTSRERVKKRKAPPPTPQSA